MSEWNIELSRKLLHDWAMWVTRGGGFAHQSSVEQFQQGGWSGIFTSRIPLDVEPSPSVSLASRTMQYLKELDGVSAELLMLLYLRKNNQTLRDMAKLSGVSLTCYQNQRRGAERKFLSLYLALEDK